MDPVELRLKNLLKEGETLPVDTPLPEGITIDKVVETCAMSAGWVRDAQSGFIKPSIVSIGNKKKGIGFACAYKNVGFSFGAKENCWAIIEIHGNENIKKVILRHAGADVGQGSHTVFKQMAAQALGVAYELVELIPSDTAITNNSGSASASRMTFMAGNAIKGAAEKALEKWNRGERPAISEHQYFAPETTPFDPETGKCKPNFAYGYVAEAIECEVDEETGKITISNVCCADDVGKAINPSLVEGQIEGCIVQAAGYSILENFITQNGKVLTDKLSTYLIPTILDIPQKVNSIILEYPDKNGPWGVRGMGEMPYLPFAPAVIDAVHDATGVWFDEFPLTPEKVYFELKKQKKKADKSLFVIRQFELSCSHVLDNLLCSLDVLCRYHYLHFAQRTNAQTINRPGRFLIYKCWNFNRFEQYPDRFRFQHSICYIYYFIPRAFFEHGSFLSSVSA